MAPALVVHLGLSELHRFHAGVSLFLFWASAGWDRLDNELVVY